MIDPQTVNPLALSSAPLNRERRSGRFPTSPCIYFAITQDKEVQYIGQAVCLRQRWQGHGKELALLRMGQVDIAYLPADIDCLDYLERELVLRFNPPLNKLKPRSMASLEVQEVE